VIHRLSFVCIVVGVVFPARAEDWPRFRGPNGSGVVAAGKLPEKFDSETNLRWKVTAGPGTSSPVIAGDRLYYSSFSGDERTLHCLNAADGTEAWKQTVMKARTEATTPPGNPATCTPVCESSFVCVLFPDAGLYCYTSSGQLKWKTDLGPFHSMHGISSSLMAADGRLIVVADQLRDPFIAAYELSDGSQAWKTERFMGVTGGYSTPCVHHGANRTTIVASGPGELVGYDAANGAKVWFAMGLTNAPISLPVISGNRVFLCEAPGEPISMAAFGNADKNGDGTITVEEVKSHAGVQRLVERIDSGFGNGDGGVDETEVQKAFGTFVGNGGLACVELGGTGDVTKSHVKWRYNKSMPSIPSVVVVDDVLYAVNDGGILLSFDAQTGELLKRDRLRDATGQYYSSPIAADGKIFLANTGGKVSVVKAGRSWEVLTTNDLGEAIYATPAICNGRLFVRTETSLMCFGTG
jgi:outer membrane protein assembly factor BamB